MTTQSVKSKHWLDRQISSIKLNWEIILFISIILIAIVTRFYDLGTRVMSHDESLHTYYSWLFFKGEGYSHSPLMHGPLQFHLLALIYNLFGDSDFTARIPAALASILSVVFIWKYRRYLGKAGALITTGLFVISPYMLYYGRYVRNEALVTLFGLVGLWTVLRYLDTGRSFYLYILSAATALHFTTKETSFIYLAQTLIFLGLIFLNQITKNPWRSLNYRKAFFSILIIVLLIAALFIGYGLIINAQTELSPDEIALPFSPENLGIGVGDIAGLSPTTITILIAGFVVLVLSLFLLFKGYGADNLRELRSFDLLMLLGSIVIPHLSAFPVRMMGWDPLNYLDTQNLQRVGGIVIVMFGLSILIGLWWKPKVWLINNAIFYGIFIFFFTSVFTNTTGFFTGLVGSLGYWLVQQGVERGNQPIYYYTLVQIPMYEYLAALGTILAACIGWRVYSRRRNNQARKESQGKQIGGNEIQDSPPPQIENQGRAILLFGFWMIASLFAYTVAGEKMPWLTVHIALPMLLLTGWALGYVVERIKWSDLKLNNRWFTVILFPLLFIGVISGLSTLMGEVTPFSGKTTEQLNATNALLLAIGISAISLWWLSRIVNKWEWRQPFYVSILIIFTLLGLQTIQTAFRTTYVNYDQATEFLVYAHGAGGIKDVMQTIDSISQRTTDGFLLEVAFDDDVSWPYTWYLRNYKNQRYYGADPNTEIRNAPIILIGDNNFHKIDPIVGDGYKQFDYIRMWWPIQDYFGLSWENIQTYITDPALRRGIFNIWLNRDYSIYSEAIGRDLSLPNWSPSDRMRMYVRKDTLANMWDYGVGAYNDSIVIDPYENQQIQILPDVEIQIGENGDLIFNAPRGIAIGQDGSLFIADSRNHRIVRVKDGKQVDAWGELSVPIDDIAPTGTFNEPWGVAVSPDGKFVYVADTWNHRVQKFSSTGKFITSWGFFGQMDDPYAFWGPREVATDPEGNVYVSNTGNKQIHVFTPKGEFLRQFGSVGFAPGQFDEPIGIAIDPISGMVFIADTWNQRIQSFSQSGPGKDNPAINWEISGWYGQSLDNKPYLTIGPNGNLFATDPELSRVLVFNQDGEFLYYFGDFETGNLGVPVGITFDGENGIWISDSKNNRLLHFTLP